MHLLQPQKRSQPDGPAAADQMDAAGCAASAGSACVAAEARAPAARARKRWLATRGMVSLKVAISLVLQACSC